MEEPAQRLVHRTELTAYELMTECRDTLMKEVVRLIDTCANCRSVLITGENGTGKELVANALRQRGDRANREFAVLDCTNLSQEMMRSEIFGHERGSFTGAIDRRIGLFERAHGGTAFLDEIGEIPLDLQSRLLRVLQGQSFTRVGGNVEIKSDFRLITATNRNLRDMVRTGKFREDLYFRIEVFSIPIPPLRERMADVIRLANHFVDELSSETKRLSCEAESAIGYHLWPGNVRELRNAIERGVKFSSGNEVISKDDLRIDPGLTVDTSGQPQQRVDEAHILQSMGYIIDHIKRLSSKDVLIAGGMSRYVEKLLIQSLLEKNGGNKMITAWQLGIGRQTLYNKLKLYETMDNGSASQQFETPSTETSQG